MHKPRSLAAIIVGVLASIGAQGPANADFSACQGCTCCRSELARASARCKKSYSHSDVVAACRQMAGDDHSECKARLCRKNSTPPRRVEFGTSTMVVENTRNCRTYAMEFENTLGAGTYYLLIHNGISDQRPNLSGVDDATVAVNGVVVVPTGSVTKSAPIHWAPVTLGSGTNTIRFDLCSIPGPEPETFLAAFLFDQQLD